MLAAALLLAGAAQPFPEDMYLLVTVINAACYTGYGVIRSQPDCGASSCRRRW